MHSVEIKQEFISWDCEACGGYQDVECIVKLHYNNSDNELRYYNDNHFGGGNWNGDMTKVYADILKVLGYKVIFLTAHQDTQYECEDMSHYQNENLDIITVIAYHFANPDYAYVTHFDIQWNNSLISVPSPNFDEVYKTVIQQLIALKEEQVFVEG